jgi:hypothetical protein
MGVNGKVAEVIPPYDIALNVGGDAGVSEGDEVTVYESVVVKDPDTDVELGRVEYARGNFKVSLVAPTFSIASSDEYLPGFNSGAAFATSSTIAFGPPPRRPIARRGQAVQDRATAATLVGIGDDVHIEKPERPEDRGDGESAPSGGEGDEAASASGKKTAGSTASRRRRKAPDAGGNQ